MRLLVLLILLIRHYCLPVQAPALVFVLYLYPNRSSQGLVMLAVGETKDERWIKVTFDRSILILFRGKSDECEALRPPAAFLV